MHFMWSNYIFNSKKQILFLFVVLFNLFFLYPTYRVIEAQTGCYIYVISEKFGTDDSQFYRINTATRVASEIGSAYSKADTEALDIHPGTEELYAMKSDTGRLYKINITTRVRTVVGDTGFSDVNDLSFRPTDNVWFINVCHCRRI